ncbi:hypothetical protein ACSSS7_003468 [Eimeria intestinalis]
MGGLLTPDMTACRRRGSVRGPPRDSARRGALNVLLGSLGVLLLLLLSFAPQDLQAASCGRNTCRLRRRHGGAPPSCCWFRSVRGSPLVWPASQDWSFRGPHSCLYGASAVRSQAQRCRCLGGDSSSVGDALGDPAESLRGVQFYVSATMAAPDVWDGMPRVLRGPAAYEAAAVQRLRAAGASMHFLLPRSNTSSSSSRSTTSSSKSGSGRKRPASRSPVVHLAVSPTPPLRVDANESFAAAAAASSSSSVSTEGPVQADAKAREETFQKERRFLGHELAFCPSGGSISCFGCFAAAAALLEEGPHAGSVAATKRGPSSPLMDASWGAPAVWLCGSETSLLRRSFRVLKGVDSRDLRTVHSQQQQQLRTRQQQQQQQQDDEPRNRLALLSIGDRQTPLLPPSPEQQLMPKNLQQLQQHQQQQQCFHQLVLGRDPLVRCLEAETLRRVVVGGALLQCCELAGLLLRMGDGGPTKGPPRPPAGGRRQVQQQQAQLQQEQESQQERQQQSYWDRVFCERTEVFSSTLKRRLLLAEGLLMMFMSINKLCVVCLCGFLGGALLNDPRKAVLLQKARAAQDALRLQLDTLSEGVEALLHLAEEPSGFALTASLERRTSGLEGPPVDRRGEVAGSTTTFRTRVFNEEQPFSCCKQLLAAVAAVGRPCIASAEGWVLLGSPGNDELLLDIAGALCSKQHSS